MRAQAVCSQEAGARLQGPLRRLLPLIGPPLAPKNNILVCLLGALRDRDRLFIPAISDAALLPPPGRPVPGPRPGLAAPAGHSPEPPLRRAPALSGFEPQLRSKAGVLIWRTPSGYRAFEVAFADAHFLVRKFLVILDFQSDLGAKHFAIWETRAEHSRSQPKVTLLAFKMLTHTA